VVRSAERQAGRADSRDLEEIPSFLFHEPLLLVEREIFTGTSKRL
jgi:hypothetical protein